MKYSQLSNSPGYTDLKALRRAHTPKFLLLGSAVNGLLVLIPLLTTLYYHHIPFPLWARILFLAVYGLLTFGTIAAWWVPYFFGMYMQVNKAGFEEYKDTHTFLPPRGDNVVPNTMHIFLHLQVWICFGLSIYWLFTE